MHLQLQKSNFSGKKKATESTTRALSILLPSRVKTPLHGAQIHGCGDFFLVVNRPEGLRVSASAWVNCAVVQGNEARMGGSVAMFHVPLPSTCRLDIRRTTCIVKSWRRNKGMWLFSVRLPRFECFCGWIEIAWVDCKCGYIQTRWLFFWNNT